MPIRRGRQPQQPHQILRIVHLRHQRDALAQTQLQRGGVHEAQGGIVFEREADRIELGDVFGRDAPRLLALAEAMNAAYPFEKTFMISAERGHGVEDLKAWLGATLPEGPWFYPEDQIADLPMRMIAAEMTREKLTLRLHEELPYQLTVETEKWEDKPDGTTRIDQVVYVARDGHKGIVLGNRGETIKSIGQAARADISEFLGRTVHLFLQVKVRPNWLEEAERYSEMGLDFKDGDA